ncbi:MAG TPA: DUF1622 domain-containing protein [Microvirga sp.]|jgi:uncharacterized membrane protein|nr:DUF1622 domain-containing protein [Microvirga sp.]
MELLKTAALWAAAGAEALAVLIIGLALIEAAFHLVRGVMRSPASERVTHREREEVRLHLGRWLVLGLEFLLAADILRTAVAPSWTEIGQLAAIAVLRTALNYFLQQEMERVEARERTEGGIG